MEPNAPPPQFELPKPMPQQPESGNAAAPESPAVPSPEKANNSGDSANQGAPPPAALPFDPAAAPPAAVPPPAPVAANPAPLKGTPSTADDNDLIEKVWVDKAKEIVRQTKDDPHRQNQAMGTFKADYIKKRYNKDIKVSEGS